MDSHTNTEGLSITFDHTQRLEPVLYVQNPASKQAERLPPSDPDQLGAPLGRVRPVPFRKEIAFDAANKTAVQATLAGLGAAVRSANAVSASASGRLQVRRYGRLLSARALVGVRGAGPAFDGLWWVDSVTHHIDCRDYIQSFTLKRNALASSVSQVPA
jgi:hypothetical protein